MSVLTAFQQHGVIFDGYVSGVQHRGRCPWCRKERHLYVNEQNSKWDCKSCGRAGGFQELLRQTYNTALEAFSGARALALQEHRGLPLASLRYYGVGYNPAADTYVIPIWRLAEQGKLLDLRHWRMPDGNKKNAIHSTATCTVGMIGWERLPAASTVWLCEGEWDTIAMYAMLRAAHSGDIAIGVPGANVFKQEWSRLFENKEVRLCYDADAPGRAAAQKVYTLLRPFAKAITCVHWPDDVPSGYDVRDHYRKEGPHALVRLKRLLRDHPPGTTAAPVIELAKEDLSGPGLEAEEVYRRYRAWLYLPSTTLLDVVFGTCIANRRPGDPLWVFIIAPPGATKSEVLIPLEGAAGVIVQSQLKPHALISGQPLAGGGDPSLLARLTGGRMLVIKDFTTVLTGRSEDREEVFGILRDAYDGRVERTYGNGVVRRFDCKFGILAGVTPALEYYTEQYVALGERFLGFRTDVAAGIAAQRPYLERARANEGRETELRSALAETARLVLRHEFRTTPEIPSAIEARLLSTAQIVSLLRGHVQRDRISKEVTHSPYSELGTRLVKQLTKLLIGVGQFRCVHRCGDSEWSVVRTVATGSIPKSTYEAMRIVWREPEREWRVGEVAEAVGLPPFPTIERLMQNMKLLGVLLQTRSVAGQSTYRLTPDIGTAIAESGLFDSTNP